jgi:hypothetical protein
MLILLTNLDLLRKRIIARSANVKTIVIVLESAIKVNIQRYLIDFQPNDEKIQMLCHFLFIY